MPRRAARPRPDRVVDLPAHTRVCPACAGPLWSAATARRTVVTLEGLVRLRLQIRSCRNPECPRHKVCLRPEQEGQFALPQHEFGLDVIALIGRLRHAEHRSIPEIHAELARRGDPEVHLHLGSAEDALPELDGTVDLVASNPPYVATTEAHIPDPEVLDHDPGIALWAGADGLDVVRLVEQAAGEGGQEVVERQVGLRLDPRDHVGRGVRE